MSVLVRGMEMPYGCANCPFVSGPVFDVNGKATYFCNVDVEGIKGRNNTDNVLDMYYGAEESFPDFCPLVEVPPHGRLIDADETIRIWDGARIEGSIKPIINARPTIIEAEGSDT